MILTLLPLPIRLQDKKHRLITPLLPKAVG